MIEDAITAHRAKSNDMPSHSEGATIPSFISLPHRSGDDRLTAAQAFGRFWLSAMIIVIAAAGRGCRCSDPSESSRDSRAGREITVSAAASLKDAFREISKQYEAREGARVNFNFGASGALQKQIETGAPVDVFASAGIPQMDALATKGLIASETRREFARKTQ